MIGRAGRYVWYACIFTAAFLVMRKVMDGLTGGVGKGAARAIGMA